MKRTILIIDDSLYMRNYIQDILSNNEFTIVGSAGTGNEGIELALELKPDLITLDNVLPDMLGSDIAKILKIDEGIQSKILMVSAIGQENVIEECKNNGVEGYLVKPFTAEILLDKVNTVFLNG